ncbi:hypothetical protein V1506DRAFT_517191 [Lipomyces tetrasporus]
MACEEQPSYQRALKFLRDNEPERRLDIRLSYENFKTLETQAAEFYGDAKYISNDQEISSCRITRIVDASERCG